MSSAFVHGLRSWVRMSLVARGPGPVLHEELHLDRQVLRLRPAQHRGHDRREHAEAVEEERFNEFCFSFFMNLSNQKFTKFCNFSLIM